jgi:peptide deformylase
MDADGLLAVCIQHEMDHLEGKLFVDYLSELKRQLIRRRLEKERKQRSSGRDSHASARSTAAPGNSRPAL